MTKLNVLGLLSSNPRDIPSGAELDLAAVLDRGSPLRTVINDDEIWGAGSIANRIIASAGSGRTLRQALASADPEVAASQLVDPQGRRLLADGDLPGFLHRRSKVAEETIRRHVERMAEWGARDGSRS